MSRKRIEPRPPMGPEPWGANDAERRCAKAILKRGKSDLFRSGWPDYLVRRRSDKKLFAVEVKCRNDQVSPSQAAMFAALESGGIPVLVWNPKYPDAFVPWRDYRAVYEQRRKGGPETFEQTCRRLDLDPVRDGWLLREDNSVDAGVSGRTINVPPPHAREGNGSVKGGNSNEKEG